VFVVDPNSSCAWLIREDTEEGPAPSRVLVLAESPWKVSIFWRLHRVMSIDVPDRARLHHHMDAPVTVGAHGTSPSNNGTGCGAQLASKDEVPESHPATGRPGFASATGIEGVALGVAFGLQVEFAAATARYHSTYLPTYRLVAMRMLLPAPPQPTMQHRLSLHVFPVRWQGRWQRGRWRVQCSLVGPGMCRW
jgi:hypothetical protein